MRSGCCSYIEPDLDAHVAVVVLANKFNRDDKVGMNLRLRLASTHAATAAE